MDRAVCIHGHFYQPPRENPWLEDVEVQDSAYPYHDWNERITTECYEPNTASRILDDEGWIRAIVNNYAYMSYNFGPTILSWLQKKRPEVYRAIIAADRESQKRFSGHGSAFAQAYNHMIMPLANSRDKHTQVVWGLRDFEHRFGRKAEGMWLPETAVDLETLEILAREGVGFTILANHQLRRIRCMQGGEWQDVAQGGADTKMPYLVRLPDSARTISVFTYDTDVSGAVAFDRLLANGERFAARLMDAFEEGRSPQLVHIATDGETYGHHHRHGDMALAFALDYITSRGLARLTNYGEYLAQYPPTYEAEIIENTSWSCRHGVERWRSDCGCNAGMDARWNQAWRAPLRQALDWLRDTIAPRFEERAGTLLKDPWWARNEYIEVILDRSRENVDRWLREQATHELSAQERIKALKLLEMQRHAMLMYTSCGWFFDELSGIETMQIIRYAARVIQLAQQVLDVSCEPEFLDLMTQAKSNIPTYRNGAHIYQEHVKPAMVDLLKVGAHYALCSLFESYDDRSHIYAYDVHREDYQTSLAGKAQLTVGKIQITSRITQESAKMVCAAVTFGNHNAGVGVGPYQSEDAYRTMVQELNVAFDKADYHEVIRSIDQRFEGSTYTLRELFKDKQRALLHTILEKSLSEVAQDYRRIYDQHVALMRFLKDLRSPQPKALATAAGFVLNANLRQALAQSPLDLGHIRALVDEARMSDVVLDKAGLGYVLERNLERMAQQMLEHPMRQTHIAELDAAVGLVYALPFEVDLWKVQNVYFQLLRTVYPEIRRTVARRGDPDAEAWVKLFCALGEKLHIRGCT